MSKMRTNLHKRVSIYSVAVTLCDGSVHEFSGVCDTSIEAQLIDSTQRDFFPPDYSYSEGPDRLIIEILCYGMRDKIAKLLGIE